MSAASPASRRDGARLLAAVAAVGAALLLAGPTVVRAEPFNVDSELAELSIEDQHGTAHRIDADTALIVFTRDMDAGDIVRDALSEDGATLLSAARAVYVSDISGMPSLVFKLFAGPKMRKRAYPMLLDRDGDRTASFPSTEGKATVVRLDALRVTAIEYAGDVAAVRAFLAPLPPNPTE